MGGVWDPWAAIILAGGRGSRLDGVDKAGIELGGRTLLEWALDGVIDAREVVVVGDPVPTERPVTFTRESPRYGGPVAGLLTGLDALMSVPRYVGVVGVDMPHVHHGTWRRLLAGARTGGSDGAILIGPDGRWQLALVLDTVRLEQVRPDYEQQHDHPMKKLLAPLTLTPVIAMDREHQDIDTWADLRDA
ncbi:molybdenum cofactor guanylyltransferase [Nocardioides sp. Iso805N]|uniref:molybdenum cofactor guanylyltransferase n=1 Tax=Nocardioides sp. Iso805N TaxID=1283287 RepID=UPI000372982A|nr:NTP transferase domain-containing protein [Nocardioides sp. Iso805N]